MLSEAKHLLRIPFFVYFVKGDRGATCEAPPVSPLTIPPTPARFLEVCAPHGLCHSPQRMRQRYAYGSNIAAVRCGWVYCIDEQWRIKNSRIQSAAVLWLRHSFARAFSGDSLPVDCFGYRLAMTRKYFGGATLVALIVSLRASVRTRGNQPYMKLESWGFCAVRLLR